MDKKNYCTKDGKCTVGDVKDCKYYTPPIFIEIIQPCVFLSNDGERCLCAAAFVEAQY